MQHVFIAAGSKWPIPLDRPLMQGRVSESPPTGRRGGKRRDRKCDHCLRDPPHFRLLLKVTWESTFGGGQRLASGGTQPHTGAVEVGMAEAGVVERGSGCPDVQDFLHCSGVDSLGVWVGDMDYVPTYWEDLRRLPPQAVLKTDGAATAGGDWMKRGCTPHYQRLCRRQACRRWRPTPTTTRTQSHST